MKKLFTLLLLCMQITAFASEALWMRYPSISPDGNSITFSYKGDIWVVSSNGGRARQLTSNTAYDYSPIWSPDGKEIAFASDRHGNFDIYTVAAEGGNPKRITTHSASETPWSYTPDGKKIVFSAKIQDPASSVLFPKSSMTELYAVSREGGRAEQLLATPAEEVSFLGTDKKFVYQDKKGGENIWRKHHTSSITRDIWLYNNGKHTKLTTFEGEDRFPCASPDGSTIYYLSEREGNFNVYSFPLSNPAQITRITNHKTHPVRFLSVSNNGTLCYGYDGGIYVKRANEAPVKIKVETIADNTASNMATLSVSGGSGATISPDGKQIAFINRGELFVTSTNYTTTKQITNTAASEADVTFSPDGRKLAYASERDGKWNIFTAELVRKEDINFPNATLIEEKPLFKKNDVDRRSPEFSPDGTELAYVENREKIMIMNLATGKIRQITDGSQHYSTTGGISFSWSPDSKWLLLSYTGNKHYPYNDIGIVKTTGGEPVINLTNSGYTDSSPRWVLDGNAILFSSERFGMRSHASWGSLEDVMIIFLNRESYDKFKMGKEDRELAKEVEKLNGNDTAKNDGKESKKADIVVELRNIEDRIIRLTPTSSNLGYATIDKEGNKLYYECSYESGMNLWELDLKRGVPVKIGPASGNLVWDKNMSTLFVLGSKFMKMKPGGKNLERINVSTEMILDKAAEREYMFDRVYRQEKARFYNTGMHGVDWEMYRDEYQKFLPHINNNYDFAEMLSELLGELNVSHTGSTHSPQAKSNDDATANLGLFFDLTWKNDGLKVDEIIEQGPFDKASSKLSKGDIITKINGIEILKEMDYYPLLNNKAGERTLITYKKPDGSIVEEVVKPVSNGTVNTLLYKRWIKWCAEEVQRLSGGRLGYVHIEGMNDASFRNVYSDILGRYNHCDGIVIDTRFNGGGRLHEDIEILFSGKKYLTQEVRGKDACDMPSRRYNKPSIMIIGEANYSNAHGTPWVYKHKGMGKLVGKPVPGTMTTVSWETMQDPTLRFGIPIVGYRQADGTYLENSQLNPDIDVENTKELVIKGRDEQLEAAVKALLAEIDATK